MRLGLLAVLLVPLTVPVTARAAPITLDFVGGTDLFTEEAGFQPIYVEEGIEITVEGRFTFPEEDTLSGVRFAVGALADRPAGDYPISTAYTLRPLSGRPFALTSIDISRVAFDAIVAYETVFADGTADTDEVETRSSALAFTGRRADGSSAGAVLDLFDFTGLDPAREGFVDLPGENRPLDLGGLGLTDLTSVTVTLRTPFGEAAICDPKNLSRRIDPSVGVPPECDPGGTLRADVSGLSASTSLDPDGEGYGMFAVVEGFEVEVAPIPLPATLPSLAAGLFFLGRIGLHRRAT